MKKSPFSNSILSSLTLYLCFFSSGILFAQKDITMTFGKKGVIIYNAKQHTISLTDNGKAILSGAAGTVVANGQTLSVKDYPAPAFAKAAFSDAIGKGAKYTLIYSAAGKPQLTQIFYTYKDRQYFITQIEIDGKGQQIATNYLAPLTEGQIAFDAAKNLHTVFVPYDNDAFVSYESKSLENLTANTSAEVGLVFNNTTRNGVIIGSLEHTVWKSAVKTTNINNAVALTAWAGYSEQAVQEIVFRMVW